MTQTVKARVIEILAEQAGMDVTDIRMAGASTTVTLLSGGRQALH